VAKVAARLGMRRCGCGAGRCGGEWWCGALRLGGQRCRRRRAAAARPGGDTPGGARADGWEAARPGRSCGAGPAGGGGGSGGGGGQRWPDLNLAPARSESADLLSKEMGGAHADGWGQAVSSSKRRWSGKTEETKTSNVKN
jgi:hypothetical protein